MGLAKFTVMLSLCQPPFADMEATLTQSHPLVGPVLPYWHCVEDKMFEDEEYKTKLHKAKLHTGMMIYEVKKKT